LIGLFSLKKNYDIFFEKEGKRRKKKEGTIMANKTESTLPPPSNNDGYDLLCEDELDEATDMAPVIINDGVRIRWLAFDHAFLICDGQEITWVDSRMTETYRIVWQKRGVGALLHQTGKMWTYAAHASKMAYNIKDGEVIYRICDSFPLRLNDDKKEDEEEDIPRA
jgi:hypothetical protein